MRVRTSAAVLVVPLLLTAVACGKSGGTSTSNGSGGKGSVTVAAFNFGESQILANMFADVLKQAGYKASVKPLTNRELVEPALEAGQVQVVPEYVGTLTDWLNRKVNGQNAKPVASSDLKQTLLALRRLAGPRHLVVLDPAQAVDQNAFAVKQDFATKNKLSKLSDLKAYKGKLVLGGPAECPKRAYCKVGLERLYGLKFSGFKALDAGGPLTKTALQKGLVQLGLVFTSDPGVTSLGLQILTDDKHLQTVDNIVPVLNERVASADVKAALQKVASALTTDDLSQLNGKVVTEHQDPAAVAKDWLTSKGLL